MVNLNADSPREAVQLLQGAAGAGVVIDNVEVRKDVLSQAPHGRGITPPHCGAVVLLDRAVGQEVARQRAGVQIQSDELVVGRERRDDVVLPGPSAECDLQACSGRLAGLQEDEIMLVRDDQLVTRLAVPDD